MSDVYTPPESDLSNQTTEVVYGGFWLRVLAALIDTIWIILLTLPLVWMVYGAAYFESAKIIQGIPDFIITYVLPFAATLAFWTYWAATPGKMILGLKIVDAETHGKVPTTRLVIRYLGYFLSAIALLLGILWIAWDKKKQGWHDKLAKTVVVKKR